MKTWDDWSDEAIDVKVTRIVFGCSGWHVTSDANKLCRFHESNRLLYTQEVIKYCNSWADMGQIIQSSNIMVGSYNGIGFACGNFRDGVDEQIWDYEFYHENPLRAAGIVFLMMNGVNPE